MTTITLQETVFDRPQQANAAYAYYDRWIESLDLPIYKGYYVEDLRTIGLGRWDERGVDAAFLQLAGQQGVTGSYVTEIRPAASTPPFRVAVDECVYVLQGLGITTVEGQDGARRSFEWGKHAMFLLPANHTYQISNTSGTEPIRLLHASYLPLAMSVVPNPDFFFNNPVIDTGRLAGSPEQEFYASAQATSRGNGTGRGVRQAWIGNFFPDMRAWDKLVPFFGRGAGGTAVFVDFPGSPMSAHMSVFPPMSYKKGHRHGPGFIIVIPVGEGYSIMWPEGGEKVVIPWHEASCFVPPARWFHQHFNVSTHPDRYLAIHPPRGLSGTGERVEGASNQIEYPDEDPFIRQKFEAELDKRGLKSVMPAQAYADPNFEWDYNEDDPSEFGKA
jgi:oxalate decarboxylase/phosphoglucose isomerase-like protein (cupin superfamily)